MWRVMERLVKGEAEVEEIDMLLDWISDGAIRSHLPMRGDVDEDETVTLTDAIRILEFLYRGGRAPLAPYPAQGRDASDTDELGCERGL